MNCPVPSLAPYGPIVSSFPQQRTCSFPDKPNARKRRSSSEAWISKLSQIFGQQLPALGPTAYVLRITSLVGRSGERDLLLSMVPGYIIFDVTLVCFIIFFFLLFFPSYCSLLPSRGTVLLCSYLVVFSRKY